MDSTRPGTTAERLARLLDLTAALSEALTPEQVAEAVVRHALPAVEASAGALMLLSDDGADLEVVRSEGFRQEVVEAWRRFQVDAATPAGDAIRGGAPLFVGSLDEGRARYPHLWSEERVAAPAMAAVPLRVDRRVIGALALTFAAPRRFSTDDRGYIAALGPLCAQALERARLFDTERRSRERQTFLAEASAMLAASLDYETTLASVAHLAVARLADWAAVDVLDEGGAIQALVVAHVDPAKVALARELRRRYPPDPNAPHGLPEVLRSGTSELYPEIPDELLVAGSVDEEHLRIVRELGLRSAMCVPLTAREKTFGAITFVSTAPSRQYTRADLAMAEDLARRIAMAIENARLYTSAQEAVRLREEFLSVASHELRTPLTPLKLHLKTLRRAPAIAGAAPLVASVDTALKQVERLGKLVEGLLDVTRLTRGTLSLDCDSFDLAALVREVAERHAEEAKRAGCDVSVEAPDVVVGVWDRLRLEQVVTNLLSNALKYGAGRPVAVAVRAHDDRARVVVSDEGIGIATEDQGRVFERFERAVSSMSYGGLGLGLYIARQLVGAHGGTIRVESAPGRGATFVVDLPRGAASETLAGQQ